MKKALKCLSVIIVMLIILFSFSITALAQTTTQDGLQVNLTTDKQSYSLNEDIQITISVTNTNDFTVKDVSIEALLPDNFELKDSNDETSTKAIDLKSGEQANLTVVAVVKGEEQNVTKPTENTVEPSTEPDNTTEPSTVSDDTTEPTTKSTENNADNTQNTKPNTQATTSIISNNDNNKNNDNNNSDKSDDNTKNNNNQDNTSIKTGSDYTYMGIFIVLLLASISTLLYCLIKHFDKTTKIVSSILCVVIAVTSVVGISKFNAFAQENKTDINKSTITLGEQIRVDNNDYTITANVDYKFNYDISLTNFKADTFDIYLNEEKLVTFTCNVTGNKRIRSNDVAVYNKEHKFIVYMNDDGMNGDLLANDGVYSGQTTLSSAEFKLEEYFATAFDSKSNIFEINFYRNLTEEEFSSFDKLHTYVTSLSFSEACNYVKNSDEINTYSIDEQNKNITYNSIYHITGVWEEEKDNSLKGSGEFSIPMIFERDYERAKPIVDKLYFSSQLKKKDVIVMRPFRNSGFEYDDFKYSGELLSSALNSALTVIDDEAVTLSEMKNLSNYGIVLIDSHGTLINGNTPNIIIGEKYKENQSYSADYSSGTINCIGTEKNLTVGRRFIEKYYQDKSLTNSFLFLGTCYSSYANDIPLALLNAGATSTIGFTDSVSLDYCNNTLFETVINSMLLSADPLEDSISSTKDFYGKCDPYNAKCELIMQGLLSYKIVDKVTDTGSIIGRVKEQGTNAPISNREVKIYNENYTSDNAMYTFIDKTKTDNNGSFKISLPVGTYTLVIDNDGENANSDYYYDTVEIKVKVDAGVDTVLLNDIVLARCENGITGYVYDNDDLINNGKNTPIADVTVEVYQNNNDTTDFIGKCKTDKNGKYTFAVDKNGSYDLSFIKSGYEDKIENMVFVNGGYVTCDAYLEKSISADKGNGTKENPYRVSNIEELKAVKNDLSAYYIQIADIDLRGESWKPIGNEENPFTGDYDGNGYTISNLKYSQYDINYKYIGLFGYNEGAISNIIINNVCLEGFSPSALDGWIPCYLGGISGYNLGEITNCEIMSGIIQTWLSYNGKVYGLNSGAKIYAGGICGINSGTIYKCVNSAKVNINSSQSAYVGGICGDNTFGEISNSFNKADVSGYCKMGDFRLRWQIDCYVAGITNSGDTTNCLCTAKNIIAKAPPSSNSQIAAIQLIYTSARFIGGSRSGENYALEEAYVFRGKTHHAYKDEIITEEYGVILTDIDTINNIWDSY